MAESTKPTMSVDKSVQPVSVDQNSQPRRYYRVQIRAWTGFDPSRMELAEIASEIDRGTGFLTAIEVLKVADDVAAIDDPDIRTSFENILAAERVLQNVAELPKALRDRLSAALSSDVKDGRSELVA